MARNRGCWRAWLQAAAVAAMVLGLENAAAREDEIEPTAPAPPVAPAGKFDMAIGIAGTTDYISRGITQSDSEPAIQGYIEPSYGLGPVLGDAFVNIWASSDVDFGGGVQGAEIDVAGGHQAEIPRSEMVTQHWLRALFLCTGRLESGLRGDLRQNRLYVRQG